MSEQKPNERRGCRECHERVVHFVTCYLNNPFYSEYRSPVLDSERGLEPRYAEVHRAIVWHSLGRPCGARPNEAEGITEIPEHVTCSVCWAVAQPRLITTLCVDHCGHDDSFRNAESGVCEHPGKRGEHSSVVCDHKCSTFPTATDVVPCIKHCGHDPSQMRDGACIAWLPYVMDTCNHRCSLPTDEEAALVVEMANDNEKQLRTALYTLATVVSSPKAMRHYARQRLEDIYGKAEVKRRVEYKP